MTSAAAEERGAAAPRGGEPEEPRRELLTVRLGAALFGIWVDEVLEIVRTPEITKLPLAAPDVAGITSVRGMLVPVLDLGLRLLATPAVRPGRLVLIRHHETGTMVGLLTDGVGTLVAVAESELRAPPAEAEAQLPPGCVTGVVTDDAGVITVLHLGRAAAPPGTSTEE